MKISPELTLQIGANIPLAVAVWVGACVALLANSGSLEVMCLTSSPGERLC